MRSPNTCCASGYQLVGDELLDISSVYVYERAVNGLDTYKKYSWYFRNALVRANYRNINKDIEYSPIYLVRFFRNLLLGESWVLKNRYLHIDPTDEWKVQPRLATPQAPHTPHQKVDRKGGQKTKDSILSLIASDPFVTTTEMSKRLGINRSAISKHIKKLKEDHRIERIGPDKGGKWLIKK